jgi:hypothetical protein
MSEFICPAPLVHFESRPAHTETYEVYPGTQCAVPCPTLDYSSTQWTHMKETLLIMIMIAFISSGGVLASHLVDRRKYERNYYRIMFSAGFFSYSLIIGLFMILNRNDDLICDGPAHYIPKNGYCLFQAASTIWFMAWTEIWLFNLVYDLYCKVVDSSEDSITQRKRLRWCTIAGLIIPSIITAIPCFATNIGFDYEANVPICLYIMSDTDKYFWFSFIVPLYLLLVVSMCFMIACAWRIHCIFINSKHYEKAALSGDREITRKRLSKGSKRSSTRHSKNNSKQDSSSSNTEPTATGVVGTDNFLLGSGSGGGGGGNNHYNSSIDTNNSGYGRDSPSRRERTSSPHANSTNSDEQKANIDSKVKSFNSKHIIIEEDEEEGQSFDGRGSLTATEINANSFDYNLSYACRDSEISNPLSDRQSIGSNHNYNNRTGGEQQYRKDPKPVSNDPLSALQAISSSEQWNNNNNNTSLSDVVANSNSNTTSPHYYDYNRNERNDEGDDGDDDDEEEDGDGHLYSVDFEDTHQAQADLLNSSTGGGGGSGSHGKSYSASSVSQRIRHNLVLTKHGMAYLRAIWMYHRRSIAFVIIFTVMAFTQLHYIYELFYNKFGYYVNSGNAFVNCLVTESYLCPNRTQTAVNEWVRTKCGSYPEHVPNIFEVSTCYPLFFSLADRIVVVLGNICGWMDCRICHRTFHYSRI